MLESNFCKEKAKKGLIEATAIFRITYVNITQGITKTKANGHGVSANHEKPVWVQCPGFRCLAYRDGQGTWRSFFNGDVLSNAVLIADQA
jgi:hypothetical protein